MLIFLDLVRKFKFKFKLREKNEFHTYPIKGGEYKWLFSECCDHNVKGNDLSSTLKKTDDISK